MKKLIAKIEDMNFSGREYFLLGVCLLLGGTLLGMLLSPKGERVIGSHNGNNEKSYPDIHSLLLLSSLFDVSLDELIKGDIEEMKLIIDEQDVQEFNYYGKIFSIHFLIMILSVVPLFYWLDLYALIPLGIWFAITMFWAIKVEKLKKKNDVQTYREIVAFTEGKKLDEISKMVEGGKRPYQNVFKFVFGAAIAVVVLMLGEMLIRFIG